VGQPINRSIEILLGACEEVSGVRPDPARYMAALLRRCEAAGVQDAYLAVAIGYRRLKRSYSRALNLALAQGVSRWALHALGPDAPLRESYPLYRRLAEARGVEPWGFTWYQTHAYGGVVHPKEPAA
jgi:hypothetical protein